MRRPKAHGSPINLSRRRAWVKHFGAYRHAVDISAVEDWLLQFQDAHKDLAARVLDSVEFVDTQRIANFYRAGLGALQGWSANPAHRLGEWRFCPWSASAGESGDLMLHNFRVANSLSGKAHDKLFINPSDIIRARLSENDSLVFVNDFVGTGTEVCEAWTSYFSEMTAGIGNVYLLVAMTCKDGRVNVTQKTSVRLVAGQELNGSDNIFAPECVHFTGPEKTTLLEYATLADRKRPKGYGDLGLVVVFQHRCPNNSVALLHASSRRWTPLFPRQD